MSVYIKGMEMPKSCYFCEMYEADLYWCSASKRDIDSFDDYDNRSSFCPLVHVPKHGRLGDLDALMKQIEHDTPLSDVFEKTIRRYLKNAPTIIPADQKEEQT